MTALAEISGLPDLAPVAPVPPPFAAREAAVAGAEWRLRLSRAVEDMAAALTGRGGADAAPGLERLFSAACILSGTDLPLRRILGAVPVAGEGLGPEGMIAALARLGIRAEKVPAGAPFAAGEPPRLVLPAKGEPRLQFRHPVGQGIVTLRPDGALADLAAEGEGGRARAFRLVPEAEAHPLSKAQRAHTGQSWFRALLGLFAPAGFALLVTVLLAAAAAVALPLFTIEIYANVISLGSLAPLPSLIAGMALLIAFETALLSQRAKILAWMANRVEFLVSAASFERILRIRPALSERVAVTDQAARLRSFENIREFITGPAFATLLEAPVGLFALVAIGCLGGWLVVVPLVGVFLHLCLFAALRRRARVLTSIAADESTEMQRVTIETFEKRDAIRQAGLQAAWSSRMTRGIRRQQTSQMALRLVGALGESLSAFILTTASILLLAGGAHAIWAGTLGSGGLLATIILGTRVLIPTHMLCLSVQRFEQLGGSLAQLNALMEIAPEREEEGETAPLRPLQGAVSFLNVGLRATDTRPVFVGLNLDIQPGEVVAVTGSNGTGKTTLLKLVQGLGDLSLGAIRIDGVDLRQLPLEELRRRIGYVPQHPRLFPGSLRENLLFADPFADEARQRAVLAETGLSALVARLPQGLDHPCGPDEDLGISSEFRFKFALSQAILADSRIILVDEIPNSLMDGDVGRFFRQLVGDNRRRRTVLFVSHRSDDLRLADKVIHLRYGNVPHVSTPDTLSASLA
ncbi:hypothetical protein GCM10011390_33580 [Aureimonas endophytica]|uniref:Uncharacterized protein n=1 Tax=Aureimonas endophytica TaxID=2027858 RepID=A0A916ZS70_9HYPH|nr:ATP-binding cassette domain-containing protein [Aureimonas endophytica]GGE11758.1 hypothetical protein GCM10011390_33580 [Aureimonas endophytica]